MPRMKSRLHALKTQTARRLNFRIFTQDPENPAHYYEGSDHAFALACRLPYTQADIERLRAQGGACIVVCYGEDIPALVCG